MVDFRLSLRALVNKTGDLEKNQFILNVFESNRDT